MKTEIYTTHSPEETEEIGRRLAAGAEGGEVYCLNGDLGAGKTVLARGFARGLGIGEAVTSPTFVIVNEYEGRLKLYHFDIYRIEDPEELFEVGFEEYLYGDGVCLIEWPERAEGMLPDPPEEPNPESPAKRIDLMICPGESDNERRIEITYR